jgi:transposase-like protein
MDRTGPRTLLEALTYFAKPERAHAYAGRCAGRTVACPRQGRGSADVQAIKTRKLWRCKECRRQFSVRVGTIFEDSPIHQVAPGLLAARDTKNGTLSCELARAIGVTQKTAWFMPLPKTLAASVSSVKPSLAVKRSKAAVCSLRSANVDPYWLATGPGTRWKRALRGSKTSSSTSSASRVRAVDEDPGPSRGSPTPRRQIQSSAPPPPPSSSGSFSAAPIAEAAFRIP